MACVFEPHRGSSALTKAAHNGRATVALSVSAPVPRAAGERLSKTPGDRAGRVVDDPVQQLVGVDSLARAWLAGQYIHAPVVERVVRVEGIGGAGGIDCVKLLELWAGEGPPCRNPGDHAQLRQGVLNVVF